MNSKLTGEGDAVDDVTKKMSESQTKAGNQRKFENLKNLKIFNFFWKFENLKFKIAQVDPRDMLNNFCFHVYDSMLKCRCLQVKMPMLFFTDINAFFVLSAPVPVSLEFIELVPSYKK